MGVNSASRGVGGAGMFLVGMGMGMGMEKASSRVGG